MTIKEYAAIVTGALAMVLTALLLWCFTKLPVQDVAATATAFYYVGIVGTFAVTDWMERRRRRHLVARIITLVKEEQKRGKEKTA